MAIVEMQKLTLMGQKQDKQKILDALHRFGCVEIDKTEEIEGLSYDDDNSLLSTVNEKIQDVEFAIDFIKEQIAEKKQISKKEKDSTFKAPKKPLFALKREISYEEFSLATAYEYEHLSVIDSLKTISSEMNEIKAEKVRLKNVSEGYKLYSKLDVPFDKITDTASTKMTMGVLPINSYNVIEKINSEFEDAFVEVIDVLSSQYIILVVSHKDSNEAVLSLLNENNYSACSYTGNKTPLELIAEINGELVELDSKLSSLRNDAVSYYDYMPKLELLYDFYSFNREKGERSKEFLVTDTTFIMEGWLPKEQSKNLDNTLDSYVCYYNLEEPKEEELPPTCLKNGKLVAPYESVVNMYSAPNYREKDPNIFVAMFFFLFFGMMLSDAGYGLILAIGGMILLKVLKLEKPTQKLLAIITMGGVSTVIWGVLFGGWFGIELPPDSFFNKIKWFTPLDEPLMMLGVCLGLGLLHILFGMGIKGAELIRKGKVWDAIFDIGSWYIFFLGLILVVVAMLAKVDILNMIGFITAGSGLVIVVLTNGRKEKGIFKKALGGLKGLYNIINYMSDILSYARLFGLGLATGVIGMVMNVVAGLFFGSPFLIPIGVIVLIVGHTFNIGINVLGAYVHTCRLHYIEFFSRFYEGEGRLFNPLGSNMKYVNITK